MRVRAISLRGSGLVDRRRVTLVLNGDRGPAEESRPEPNGASQQEAPEGGRFGLEEAWEDVLRQQELLRKRAESKRQKAEDQETLWREFMATERREIVQRQNGRRARPPGGPPPRARAA